MEKIRIIKDFYETSRVIKDMFGDSLADALLLSDWSPQKQDGGVVSVIRKSPFWGIATNDSINKISFSYDVPYGITIIGEFLYRTSRHGIELLSGIAIFAEEDK